MSSRLCFAPCHNLLDCCTFDHTSSANLVDTPLRVSPALLYSRHALDEGITGDGAGPRSRMRPELLHQTRRRRAALLPEKPRQGWPGSTLKTLAQCQMAVSRARAASGTRHNASPTQCHPGSHEAGRYRSPRQSVGGLNVDTWRRPNWVP